MMIIKHGNKWYYFVCPSCGCEWSTGMKEAHQGEEAIFCNCPECGYFTEQCMMKNKPVEDCERAFWDGKSYIVAL